MSRFTVLFELFSLYDDKDLNRSECLQDFYKGNNVEEVFQEIEDGEEFDDSEIIDFDHSDQLRETGRDIIYIKDEKDIIVYSRESNRVTINLSTDLEVILDEKDVSDEELTRLSNLPDSEKRNELKPYISSVVESFEQEFEKYFGKLSDYSSDDEFREYTHI
ncbi:MAG: hypothetical protein U5P10_00130 [Spirochaetia bacterium]|nr:hypothetical protein [Spirochaetia bacterium]